MGVGRDCHSSWIPSSRIAAAEVCKTFFVSICEYLIGRIFTRAFHH